jgi:hypothetical protein
MGAEFMGLYLGLVYSVVRPHVPVYILRFSRIGLNPVSYVLR